MDGSLTFHSGPGGRDRRDRRLAAVVLVLVVAFLGLAIAKPWSSGASDGSSSGPSSPAAGAATPASAASASPPAIEPATARRPSPGMAFTTPAPVSAAWASLRWRRLAPDDPLALVTSVVRWRGGYVATGWLDSPAGPATPVWTSRDGVRWEPLPFGTATTFWPDAIVLSVVAVPAGLVAITEQLGAACPVCAPLIPPAISWTSRDGRSWTPHTLPPGGPVGPAGTGPVTASGPAGIVVASMGTGHRIATSRDGVSWALVPADALPVGFVLVDVAATAEGYVAAGRWDTGKGGRAAVFTSTDGRTWTPRPMLLPPAAGLADAVGTTVDRLVTGADGVVAVGHTMATPATTLWWQSPDGRRWRVVSGYPPPGGADVALRSGGWLVSDGRLLLGLRAEVAWTSADGLAWGLLPMSGDLPSAPAVAVLLPSGVLVSDGGTSWLGEAIAR